MTYVRRDISDYDLLQIIKFWINVLAEKRYQDFLDALGYSLGNGEPKVEWILSDLRQYNSDLYLDTEPFEITDWRTASGGNKKPRSEVIRYESNDSGLAAAVTFDLPLNGKWSDLAADFVLFETGSPLGLLLKLEEINVNT